MRHSTIRLFTDHETGETVLMGQYPDGIWMEVGRQPREANIKHVLQMVRLEFDAASTDTKRRSEQ